MAQTCAFISRFKQILITIGILFLFRACALLAHGGPVQVPLELPAVPRWEDGADQGADEDLPQDRGPLHPDPPPPQGGSEVIREREEILLSASLHLLVRKKAFSFLISIFTFYT